MFRVSPIIPGTLRSEDFDDFWRVDESGDITVFEKWKVIRNVPEGMISENNSSPNTHHNNISRYISSHFDAQRPVPDALQHVSGEIQKFQKVVPGK